MATTDRGKGGTHVEGEYRCAACGHGERLQACAEAIVAGMLQPDGEVTQDDVSQTVLCESSIECIEHQDSSLLQQWVDGRWTRWQACEYRDPHYTWQRCELGSLVGDGRRVGRCPECKGAGGFNVPVEAIHA